MPVTVTSFNDPTAWSYIHDDAPGGSHGGTLDPATVTYGTNIDGTDNLNVVAVPCPEGDAVSYWPPGGGADALLGQMLHVQVGIKAQAPAGRAANGATTRTTEDVVADVKQRVIDTDGEERWVLDEAAMAVLEARAT